MMQCTNPDVKDLLPDLLNGILAPADVAHIELHLAGCSSCLEELQSLRAFRSVVMSSAPSIDTSRVALAIPLYRPAPRPRSGWWQVAAGISIIAAGLGGMIYGRGLPPSSTESGATVRTDTIRLSKTGNTSTESATVKHSADTSPFQSQRVRRPYGVLLGVDVSRMSADRLERLMRELDRIDGATWGETPTVIPVVASMERE
jgi:hypothetical protein